MYYNVVFRSLMKSASYTVTSVQASDLIKLLRDRILELMPYGLCRIWFCIKGQSIRPLATILGYSEETLLGILRFTALSRQDGGYMYENWESILNIPVDKRVFSQEVYVRFGPIQVSRRVVLTPNEVKMHQEASSTTPNDAYQEQFFSEFLEAVSETRGKLRDRRLTSDMLRWLAEQREVMENDLTAIDIDSDDDTVSDEVNTDCFVTPESDLRPSHIRNFDSLSEDQQREIAEHWLASNYNSLDHISIKTHQIYHQPFKNIILKIKLKALLQTRVAT